MQATEVLQIKHHHDQENAPGFDGANQARPALEGAMRQSWMSS